MHRVFTSDTPRTTARIQKYDEYLSPNSLDALSFCEYGLSRTVLFSVTADFDFFSGASDWTEGVIEPIRNTEASLTREGAHAFTFVF